jgi:hypothetical protein
MSAIFFLMKSFGCNAESGISLTFTINPPHCFVLPHLGGSILELSMEKSEIIHAISFLTWVPAEMYSLEKKAIDKLYIRVLITILFLLPLLGGCTIWHTSCLVLSDGESGRVMARLPFNPQQPIILESINSIYHAPVRETLMLEPRGNLYIVMVESPSQDVFRYYGLEPDLTGKVMLHRKVEKVRLRSSDYSNHRITAGNRTLHLKGVVPDGESILLDVAFHSDCTDE